MNILVIAPHADDEILGLGATIAKHIANEDTVYICIATRGIMPLFDDEFMKVLRSQTLAAHKLLRITDTFFLEFPSVLLDQTSRYQIIDKISEIIQKIEPSIVYLPHFGDMQKDHQIISEASMVALRPKYKHKVKAIYAYETLSETEWNIPHSANSFMPNVYIDISDFLKVKLEAMQIYDSQLSDFPNPRSLEAIEALAKYRGSSISVKAAEAFMLIREIK